VVGICKSWLKGRVADNVFPGVVCGVMDGCEGSCEVDVRDPVVGDMVIGTGLGSIGKEVLPGTGVDGTLAEHPARRNEKRRIKRKDESFIYNRQDSGKITGRENSCG
jgi:hypothetical protein